MKQNPRLWVGISLTLLVAAGAGSLALVFRDPRPMAELPGGRAWLDRMAYGSHFRRDFSGTGWTREIRSLFAHVPRVPQGNPPQPRWMPDHLHFDLSVRYQPDFQGSQQYTAELADETGYRIPGGEAVFLDREDELFTVAVPMGGGAPLVVSGTVGWSLGVLAEVFPRRGRSVLLRLLDADTGALQCQFAVPNPTRPGPFPEWKATPLPTIQHSGGLSVELLRLQSGVTPPTEAGVVDRLHEPWIRADLRVRERGNPTTRWEPAAFALSDATGNQYEHTEPRSELRGGVLRCYSIQTLSSSEPVWKVRIRLRRANTTAHPAAPGRARFWTPVPLVIPPFPAAWSTQQSGTAGGARITMTAETESRPEGDPAAVRITLAAEPATWVPDLRILDPQNEFVRLPHARLTAEPGRAVWRIPVAAEGDTLRLQVRVAQEPEFEFLVRPQ